MHIKKAKLNVHSTYMHLIPVLCLFSYKIEFFFLPKQSQKSRSVGLFRNGCSGMGKTGTVAKFQRTV